MAFMEISIVPLGTKTTSLSEYVANIIKLLRKSNLDFELHDMGTTIQGPVEELFEVAKKLHNVPFKDDVMRVYTVIKIDDRRDKKAALGTKSKAVINQL